MTALKCEISPLHIHTRDRMRLLVDGPIKFLGHRGDFCSTPQLTLMAPGALCFVDH